MLTSESGPISLTRTDVHVHPNVVQNEYVCTSQGQQYSYGASDSAQTVSFSGYPSCTEHYTQQYSDSQQIVDNSSHYTYQSTPSLTTNPSTTAPDESLSVDEATVSLHVHDIHEIMEHMICVHTDMQRYWIDAHVYTCTVCKN